MLGFPELVPELLLLFELEPRLVSDFSPAAEQASGISVRASASAENGRWDNAGSPCGGRRRDSTAADQAILTPTWKRFQLELAAA